MAEQRHRSSLKQQNKPFKSWGKPTTRAKSKGRPAPAALPGSAMDWVTLNKHDRANYVQQRRQKQREDLVMRRRGLRVEGKQGTMEVEAGGRAPRLVGVFASNDTSDISLVTTQLHSQCLPHPNSTFSLPSGFKDLFLQFRPIPRDLIHLLDVCKAADVLVLVLTVSHFNSSAVKLDPEVNSPFDEMMHMCLTALRTQGMPRVVGWLQGLDSLPGKKQKDVKKLMKRFFESEIMDGKFVLDSDLPKAIRTIATLAETAEEQQWREMRAYFVSEQQTYDEQTLELTVSGYLRGSGHLNADQLIHLTGYGDFQLSSLELPGQIFTPSANCESLNPENDPGPFASEQALPHEDDLVSAMTGLTIVKTDHDVGGGEIEEDESGDEDLAVEEDVKQVKLTQRTREELDFPDEVDTPGDKAARVRFQKYRGLKSFRTSPWDPYESLPEQYSRLYEFKENVSTVRNASLEQAKKASQTELGQYVTLKVKNVPTAIKEHPGTLPLIVSTVLPFERKLTVMHYKVTKVGEEGVESKEAVGMHAGFRRVVCRPVYSEDSVVEGKSRYLRSLPASGLASLYCPLHFPPCNLLLFKSTSTSHTVTGEQLLATGSILGFDPKLVLVKRILLTGYPLKIHKRKSVVRFMFYDPKDVCYFQPIELFTRKGLRGHIKEAVGTHGNMKCVFSDRIQHSDVICLPLYKRVFPVFDRSLWS